MLVPGIQPRRTAGRRQDPTLRHAEGGEPRRRTGHRDGIRQRHQEGGSHGLHRQHWCRKTFAERRRQCIHGAGGQSGRRELPHDGRPTGSRHLHQHPEHGQRPVRDRRRTVDPGVVQQPRFQRHREHLGAEGRLGRHLRRAGGQRRDRRDNQERPENGPLGQHQRLLRRAVVVPLPPSGRHRNLHRGTYPVGNDHRFARRVLDGRPEQLPQRNAPRIRLVRLCRPQLGPAGLYQRECLGRHEKDQLLHLPRRPRPEVRHQQLRRIPALQRPIQPRRPHQQTPEGRGALQRPL